ncbi:unnamed protein product [Lasius platythorax]|uniref:Uncharacterized protein n=1 Tax=Lasius platythorax TaxID=488582 RepID=A0AAV2NKI6_9HYME
MNAHREKTLAPYLIPRQSYNVSRRSVTSASEQAKTIVANKSLPIGRHVSIVMRSSGLRLNVHIHNRPSIGRRTLPGGVSMLNETMRGASCCCTVLLVFSSPHPFTSSRNNTTIVSFSTAGFTGAHTPSRRNPDLIHGVYRGHAGIEAKRVDKIAAGYRLAYTWFTCASERYSYLGLLSLTPAPRAAVDIAPRYGTATKRPYATTTVSI